MKLVPPKFLYHGTSSNLLPAILEGGIKPRGENPSLWSSFPSRSDCLYLTTAYPFFFGQQAAEKTGKDSICVLEIDVELLPPWWLLPDEDFLFAAGERGVPGLPKRSHDWYKTNLERFSDYWLPSVFCLGNCALKGCVMPEAITRVCTVELSRDKLLMKVSDPSITLMNYVVLGDYYKGLVKWFFGDRPDIPSQWGAELPCEEDTEAGKMYRANQDYLRGLSTDRTGIRVEEVQPKREEMKCLG